MEPSFFTWDEQTLSGIASQKQLQINETKIRGTNVGELSKSNPDHDEVSCFSSLAVSPSQRKKTKQEERTKKRVKRKQQ